MRKLVALYDLKLLGAHVNIEDYVILYTELQHLVKLIKLFKHYHQNSRIPFDVLTSYISCRWGLNTEKCDVMCNVTIHQSQHSCQG
jgi:predicted amidophosphoribosyltransferase